MKKIVISVALAAALTQAASAVQIHQAAGEWNGAGFKYELTTPNLPELQEKGYYEIGDEDDKLRIDLSEIDSEEEEEIYTTIGAPNSVAYVTTADEGSITNLQGANVVFHTGWWDNGFSADADLGNIALITGYPYDESGKLAAETTWSENAFSFGSSNTKMKNLFVDKYVRLSLADNLNAQNVLISGSLIVEADDILIKADKITFKEDIDKLSDAEIAAKSGVPFAAHMPIKINGLTDGELEPLDILVAFDSATIDAPIEFEGRFDLGYLLGNELKYDYFVADASYATFKQSIHMPELTASNAKFIPNKTLLASSKTKDSIGALKANNGYIKHQGPITSDGYLYSYILFTGGDNTLDLSDIDNLEAGEYKIARAINSDETPGWISNDIFTRNQVKCAVPARCTIEVRELQEEGASYVQVDDEGKYATALHINTPITETTDDINEAIKWKWRAYILKVEYEKGSEPVMTPSSETSASSSLAPVEEATHDSMAMTPLAPARVSTPMTNLREDTLITIEPTTTIEEAASTTVEAESSTKPNLETDSPMPPASEEIEEDNLSSALDKTSNLPEDLHAGEEIADEIVAENTQIQPAGSVTAEIQPAESVTTETTSELEPEGTAWMEIKPANKIEPEEEPEPASAETSAEAPATAAATNKIAATKLEPADKIEPVAPATAEATANNPAIAPVPAITKTPAASASSKIPATKLEPAKTKIPASELKPASTKIPATKLEPATTKIPATKLEPAKTKIPATKLEPAKTKIPATAIEDTATTQPANKPGDKMDASTLSAPGATPSTMEPIYAPFNPNLIGTAQLIALASSEGSEMFYDRLGDLKTGHSSGIWLRTKGGALQYMDNKATRFSLQIGVDKTSDYGDWTVFGGMYAKASGSDSKSSKMQNISRTKAGAIAPNYELRLRGFGGGVYASALHANGAYVDAQLSASHVYARSQTHSTHGFNSLFARAEAGWVFGERLKFVPSAAVSASYASAFSMSDQLGKLDFKAFSDVAIEPGVSLQYQLNDAVKLRTGLRAILPLNQREFSFYAARLNEAEGADFIKHSAKLKSNKRLISEVGANFKWHDLECSLGASMSHFGAADRDYLFNFTMRKSF